MVFSSMTFVWIFLPIIILGYYLLRGKCRNVFLLIGSLIFYAWGEPIYILVMLFSIIINWGIGILIDKYRDKKKVFLILDIAINILLLGYFKYFNFLVEIFNDFFHQSMEMRDIVLPIGISFFTFQILSYIIDLYRGEYAAQKNIINLALYISFFPQLIAGPIVKYKDINEQLSHRVVTLDKAAQGMRRFMYGFGKKVIISNTLALCADNIYALNVNDLTSALAWIASIVYTLQIYYDFSGYSDMAIGLGKIFGFDFPENFEYPYLTRSIQEFWQRWHISLGTWFREYLYIPLGGNRVGKIRTYINLVIVFFATGLWHGASFNFVLWGLFHGLFSVIERCGFAKFLKKHKIFSHIYSLLIINFGWVLFRAENLKQAGEMFKHMLMPWNYLGTSLSYSEIFNNRTIICIVFSIVGCGIIQSILNKYEITRRLKYSCAEVVFGVMIFVVSIAMLASNTYNPFIYFRF